MISVGRPAALVRLSWGSMDSKRVTEVNACRTISNELNGDRKE